MGKSSSRVHDCRCPHWPDCVNHHAQEFGGGEPDICVPHEHLEGAASAEEAMARRVIASIMDEFPQEAQERILAGVRRADLHVVVR